MDWQNCCLLFVAAVLGGAVNAVAGGGTLLTFPALLWAGQLEIVANATSTVALWPGALSSFWSYRSELRSSRREMAVLAVPSFVGGISGGRAAAGHRQRHVRGDRALLDPPGHAAVHRPEAAGSMASAPRRPIAGTTTSPRRLPPMKSESTRIPPRWHVGLAVLVFQFLVGVYGGYFGAGIGILMLAAFGFLGFTNIHHMNALKNLNAMCINGIAAAMFIGKGWSIGGWRC